MKQYTKDLGRVALVPEGVWSENKAYDKLSIVYNKCDKFAYVSRKEVPVGVDIDNKEYWQPLNVNGYADNNFINLTKADENNQITGYDNIVEAATSVSVYNRRVGAVLSFYNINSDRLDRQPEFELWQFNSTNVNDWNKESAWQNIYYNWNVFVGWYLGLDALKNHISEPSVGQYAYIGSTLNDALLVQCRANKIWTVTNTKVRDYISVKVEGNITIGDNGNWFNDGKDTGIPATPSVDEELDSIVSQIKALKVVAENLHTEDVRIEEKVDANKVKIEEQLNENIKTLDSKIDNVNSKLQTQITSNDEDIEKLQTRSTQLEESVKDITASGGASTANAVSYNNKTSKLDAVNAQGAIDELQTKKFDKENIAQELGNAEDKVASLSLLNKLTQEGYKYLGVANTRTYPVIPKQNVFYVAKDPGVYTRFDDLKVTSLSLLYKAINEEKWKCQQIVDSILYLDKSNMMDIPRKSGFVKYTNGVVSSFTGNEWYNTEKLYLLEGTEIEYSFNYSSKNAAIIAAYDKDGNYLQDKSVGDSTEPISGIYTIEKDVEYIVITYYGYLNHSLVINNFYKSLINRNQIKTDENKKQLDSLFVIDVLNLPTSQAYIRFDNGNIQSTTSDWYSTEKMYLSVGTKIDYLFKYSTSNAAMIAAYDEEGKYLQDTSVGNSTEAITGTYTVQEGTAFIRFCWYGLKGNNLISIKDSYQKNIERVSCLKDDIYNMQSLSDLETIKTAIASVSTEIANIKKTKADSYVYMSCVRKPFEFSGKKALFCGDSITYGFTSGTTHVKGKGDYPKLFSEKVGMTYSNVGVAGATIAKVDNYGFIFNQISNIDNTYDYLFIAGGVNDWQLGVSLSSFKSAVKYYCDNINNNLPNSLKVIWITPINQGGYEDTHPEITSRVKGTLQEFRNAMTEVVSSNDTYSRFSIIQGNEFNFPTKDMNADYISFAYGDKLHPSEAAYKSLYLTGLQNALL